MFAISDSTARAAARYSCCVILSAAGRTDRPDAALRAGKYPSKILQVLQIVFGKVVLVSSLAVDWPFGVGLRLYIGFAQAVDYDVGMDVACSIIAICMGADQNPDAPEN